MRSIAIKCEHLVDHSLFCSMLKKNYSIKEEDLWIIRGEFSYIHQSIACNAAMVYEMHFVVGCQPDGLGEVSKNVMYLHLCRLPRSQCPQSHDPSFVSIRKEDPGDGSKKYQGESLGHERGISCQCDPALSHHKLPMILLWHHLTSSGVWLWWASSGHIEPPAVCTSIYRSTREIWFSCFCNWTYSHGPHDLLL